MTTTEARGPERPRHIDARIRAIGVDDLARAAVLPSDAPEPTIAELRSRLAPRRPIWDLADWARGARGTEAGSDAIEAADALVRHGIDVTGHGSGRSRLYGFHYLRWLDPLPRAHLLTGDEVYARTFSRLIQDWEKVRDDLVGEWPGLDVVWYSLGCWCRSAVLLPALHAFGDALEDRAWLATVTTLLGGARWIHDEHTAFRHGNWQLVAATQLLHLAHVMPGFEESQAWRERAMDRIQEHLALDFYPDGGHYERSPGYHLMCLRNLQIAAVADAEHGTGALVADPRLHRAHSWISTMTTPAGWAPAFQDSQVEWPGDVLLRGAWILGDTALLHTARDLMPPELFDREVEVLPPSAVAWIRSAAASAPVPGSTGSVVLPDSGYTVLRSPSGTDGLRATINHGPHIEHELESHSHEAVLDFVLDRDGRPLLWEAGGPPDYDDPRYRAWFQAPAGHNAVTVDGVAPDPDRRPTGRLLEGAGFSVFVGTQEGYGVLQRRTIALVPGDQPFLLIRDRVEDPGVEEEHEYSLRLHAPAPWDPAGENAWRTEALMASTRGAGPGRIEALGEARTPGQVYGQAPYGELATLTFTNRTGAFDTLLVPEDGAGAPDGAPSPPAPSEAAPILMEPGHPGGPDPDPDPDTTLVGTSGATVRLTSSSVLLRPTRPGLALRALSWQVHDLDDGQDTVLTASIPVDIALERRDGEFTATITCRTRCSITLGAPAERLRLDGIELEDPGDRVTLPYGGTWVLAGRHA